MKLFRVAVELDIMVIAESAYAAAEWARSNSDEWRDEIDNADVHAAEATRLIGDEGESLPWHAHVKAPERTCAEWLEAAKAKVTP
jgi:thiamine biosynthesis lipoprotein ApbE